jgi:hypothetical protein
MDQLIVSDTGFPLDNESLRRIQQAYGTPFEGMAAALGDMVIIAGVEDTGAALTGGWVIFNNELLPVQAGALQPNLELVSEITDLFYDNGQPTPLPGYERRFMRPVAGAGTPISDFKRLIEQKELTKLTRVGRASFIYDGNSQNTTTIVFYGEIINAYRMDILGKVLFRFTVPPKYLPFIPLVNRAGINQGVDALSYDVLPTASLGPAINQNEITINVHNLDVGTPFRYTFDINILHS